MAKVNINAKGLSDSVFNLKNPLGTFTINVKLKIPKRIRVRLWLGAIIVKLGAWIINCNVNIEKEKE